MVGGRRSVMRLVAVKKTPIIFTRWNRPSDVVLLTINHTTTGDLNMVKHIGFTALGLFFLLAIIVVIGAVLSTMQVIVEGGWKYPTAILQRLAY
jgi:hypothetical protein